MTHEPRILLSHGAGGRRTRELVEDLFLAVLGEPPLAPPTDAALLPSLGAGHPAVAIDGFVVDPLEFPGGDVGGLSVCGTVNDLAMVGARPRWLSWGLILEEGTRLSRLERITHSAADAARRAGVSIVAGDTKVVPRGKGDGIYITTSGLGVVPPERDLGDHRIRAGDRILCSGPIGDHGAAVLAARHGIQGPASDVAPLNGLVETLLEAGVSVRALHDPTRGGIIAAGHEVAARASVTITLTESELPVRGAVRTVCELLGMDPLALACEGRLLAWVAPDDVERALDALRSHPLGQDAALIGEVEQTSEGGAPVVLRTRYGQRRPLDLLAGDDLPRIC